jgi:hypothetical protein
MNDQDIPPLVDLAPVVLSIITITVRYLPSEQ